MARRTPCLLPFGTNLAVPMKHNALDVKQPSHPSSFPPRRRDQQYEFSSPATLYGSMLQPADQPIGFAILHTNEALMAAPSVDDECRCCRSYSPLANSQLSAMDLNGRIAGHLRGGPPIVGSLFEEISEFASGVDQCKGEVAGVAKMGSGMNR